MQGKSRQKAQFMYNKEHYEPVYNVADNAGSFSQHLLEARTDH